MLTYAVRRVLVSIPLLLAASVLVFVLVANLGDPRKLEDAIARPNASAATIERIREEFELDRPLGERYVGWLGGFVTGDFGVDGDGVEVRDDLWRAAHVTLRLLVVAQLCALLLGAVVGVIGAVRQYSGFDYVATGLAFFLFSIPFAVVAGFLKFFGIIGFNERARHPTMSPWLLVVLALAGLACGAALVRRRQRLEHRPHLHGVVLGAVAGLAIVLAVAVVFKWGWDGNVYRERNPQGLVPTVGQAPTRLPDDLWQRMQSYFYHHVGPTLTLIAIGFAGYSRYVRASMLEQLDADFVRTARAKGAPERRVVVRHAMRNALIPLVTVAAVDFGALLSGAVIAETVFAWKGMGSFFVEALRNREPEPLMAFVMVTATAVIVFNLLADLLYAVLDPRTRR